MRKTAIHFAVVLILFAIQSHSFAQTLPVVGSVLAGHTQNVINTGLTDNTPLTIQNTGSVPLRFCMAGAPTATCVGSNVGLVVNAATTVNITVADLGGINSGAYLNVTNEALLILGSFKVDRTGSVLPCVPTARWNPGCNTTQVDLPANYMNTAPAGTFVGIGTSAIPTANLQVVGTQRLDGTFTHTGNLIANGDVTRSGNATHTGNVTQTGNYTLTGVLNITSDQSNKIILNSSSSTQAKSQLSFQQNGVEAWSLGIDQAANNSKGFYLFNTTAGITPFFVSPTGKIGINTTSPSEDYALSVNGNIRVKKVIVETGWSDFVFQKGYKLISLSELEQYIKANSHLPEIPSAKEVEEKGADVNELLKKQMQKIEELTLYVIEQNKQIAQQNKKIEKLEKKVSSIRK